METTVALEKEARAKLEARMWQGGNRLPMMSPPMPPPPMYTWSPALPRQLAKPRRSVARRASSAKLRVIKFTQVVTSCPATVLALVATAFAIGWSI